MNICRKWFEDADREFVQAVQNVMTASTGDDVAMMRHSTERDMWKCRWEEFRHEMSKLSMLAEIRHAAKHAAQIEAQISTGPVVIRFDSVEEWLAHKPATPVVCNDPKHAYSVDLQQSIHGPTTVRISVGGVLRHACSHPPTIAPTPPRTLEFAVRIQADGPAFTIRTRLLESDVTALAPIIFAKGGSKAFITFEAIPAQPAEDVRS